MKPLYLSLFALLISAIGIAQPTIQYPLYSTLEEANEMAYEWTSPALAQPTISGGGQVWDFSSLDFNDASLVTNNIEITTNFNDPNYPNANVRWTADFNSTPMNIYMEENTGGIYNWGLDLFALVYTDSKLAFPNNLTYEATILDTYDGSSAFGPDTGSIVFNYVAYGELRVPGKTYPDVALVEEVDNGDTTYNFYNIGFDAVYFSRDESGNISSLDVSLVQTVVLSDFAKEEASIWFTQFDQEISATQNLQKMELVDLTGQVVATSFEETISYDRPGLYILRGTKANGTILTERVKL